MKEVNEELIIALSEFLIEVKEIFSDEFFDNDMLSNLLILLSGLRQYQWDQIKDLLLELKVEDMAKKFEPGYVYLIRTSKHHYKIGLAKTPRIGVRLIQVLGKEQKGEFIHKIKTDDCSRLEIELHEEFADKRVGQEIFELSTIDVEYLKTISSKYYYEDSERSEHLTLF